MIQSYVFPIHMELISGEGLQRRDIIRRNRNRRVLQQGEPVYLQP
jgi:hypothetical protein